MPFASQAICLLLGMDPSDWRLIADDVATLGLAMGVDYKRHEAKFNAACDRLMEISRELVERAHSGRDKESYVVRPVSRFDALGSLNDQALLDLLFALPTAATLGRSIFLWPMLSTETGCLPIAIPSRSESEFTKFEARHRYTCLQEFTASRLLELAVRGNGGGPPIADFQILLVNSSVASSF